MFKNEYQGGQFFEVFTVQGKDPLVNWKVSGGIRKVYDRLVKGFIFALEGSSSTTKIQLPKDSKSTLSLIQRYLVIQLFVPSGQDFSVELGVSDLQKSKRRLFLSTAHKDARPADVTPLHAKIPLHVLKKGMWCNLCLDLVSLVGDTWRGQTHKSLESITLSANCKLRKIFTMKTQPPDDDPDTMSISESQATFEVESIPKQFQLPTDVNQMTMVLMMSKVRPDVPGRKMSNAGQDVNQSLTDAELLSSASRRGQEYRIAFGSKVPVSSASNKRGKEGNVNVSSRISRQFSKSRSDDMLSARGETPLLTDDVKPGVDDVTNDMDDVTSRRIDRGSRSWTGGTINLNDETSFNGSHQNQSNERTPHPSTHSHSTNERPPLSHPPQASANERSVMPHPPSQPSNERARRRIRVKSAGTERMAAKFNQTPKEEPLNDNNFVIPTPKLSAEPSRSPSRLHDDTTDSGLHSDVSPSRHGNQRISSPLANGRHGNQRIRSPGQHAYRLGNQEHSHSPLRSERRSPKPSSPKTSPSNSPLPSYNETNDTVDTGYHDDDSHSPSKSDGSHGNLSRGGTLDQDDSISDVIEALRHQVRRVEAESSEEESDAEDEIIRNSYEDSDEEPSSGRNVYMFHSPPKLPSRLDDSAPKHSSTNQRRKSSIVRQLESSLDRGPAPADDFRSSVSDDDYDSRPNFEPKSKLKISRKSPQKSGKNQLSPGGTVSRMSINKRSLREIPADDARLTHLHQLPTYDSRRYSGDALNDTDDMEARMLASLQRQAQAEAAPVSQDQSPSQQGRYLEKHVYDDSSSSEEDTNSFSTGRAVPNLLSHHYQDEMQLPSSRTSQDTLGSSNPRDWTGVFSPPIVLPGDMDHDKSDRSDRSDRSDDSSHQPRLQHRIPGVKPRIQVNGETGEKDGSEEELDLLYDQCLNCYFDPKSCRYYELV